MSSKSPGPKRKLIVVNVLMLDDTEVPFQLEAKVTGNDLISLVYEYLKLVESDYFGLEFFDAKGKKCWLDYDKPVMKQVQHDTKLVFGVKFYTPDPGQLEEEYTRYLYALQIKRDLSEGLLLCSDATACLLVSYILQAEIGDYLESFNDNPNYFQSKRYFPHQKEDHASKIIDYHKSHSGQTPADADLNLLDIARKVELYGVLMHPAKDHEGVQLNLAVANMGILVFQNFTKINTFSWAKIRKLSFRRKKFLVKLHSENYGFYKDTVEFYFENRDDSKSFWKKCIEHHSFFRCISIMHIPRQKSKLFATRGSSFRYYGRTQKELIENARENFSKSRLFDRSYHSIRSIVTGGTNGVGGGNINGTQSLNRNLSSRSAGALIIPSNGGCGSSTLSSNDSDQNYNLGLNQNTSASAHHLSYVSRDNNNNNNTNNNLNNNRSATFGNSNDKTGLSLRSLDEQKINDGLNNTMPSLKMKQKNENTNHSKNKRNNNNHNHYNMHDDTSTHGSRTIDSRYSHDKTLGLSDGDEVEDDDEDDVENESDQDEDRHIDDPEEEDEKIKDDYCPCGQQHDENNNEKENGDLEESICANNNNIKSGIQNLPNFLNMLDENNQDIDNNINNNQSTPSSFRIGSSSYYGNQQQQPHHPSEIIKLPIQQQQKGLTSNANNSNNQIKLEINSSVPTTDNESQAATSTSLQLNTNNNPNKIYSRKEVITTSSYKEEIKNTHLEEYHQTTTFYDSPNHQSETSSSFNPSAAMSNQQGLLLQPLNHQQQLKLKSKPSPQQPDNKCHNQQDQLDISNRMNDDEASENDQECLATNILYSNFQKNNFYKPIVNNIERLKRPSSLSKALIPSSPTHHNNYLNFEVTDHSNHNLNQNQHSNFPEPPIRNNVNDCHILSSSSNTNQNQNLACFIEDEFRRKKNGNLDNKHSYSIVKELVMTERTFKRDLDLLTVVFRQFFSVKGFNLNELIPLFGKLLYSQSLEQINEFHTTFLKDLELRLFQWSEKSNVKNDLNQKIGDLLGNLNQIIKNYKSYIDTYMDILNELDLTCKRNKKFESLFKDFESQKICYLPFTMFLIKPLQRLIHYKLLCKRLLDYYGSRHHDYQETYSIYLVLDEINQFIDQKLEDIENKQKVMDLQRDLIGVENLATFNSNNSKASFTRRFIREGSLQKLSRKGYQQRMFFLFNDMFLYCARSSTPILQFKVHGEFHLNKIQVEDGNAHINIPNSFTIYSSNRSLLVAAVSQEEKSKWLQDLYSAIENVKKNPDDEKFLSLKSNSSSENNLDSTGADLDDYKDNHTNKETSENQVNLQNTANNEKSDSQNKLNITQQAHRANTTMHVCWHRNTSVSCLDNHRSLVNQLSGYLLRKFKNSNGWQKLWVVFSNFCLFFYKSYQDEFPLASLPLLGYVITLPSQSDNITKDYVFKLKFKNHVYFFRAESQYSFDRWLEVIESAAQKQCTFIHEE